ncbi:MAG: SDR family oxidoreductase [Elusimicrobia bacterium]|nr:SDR family oxidoreductase [Elusimicrobiota bacterium]
MASSLAKKVLVLGATGELGGALLRVALRPEFRNLQLTGTYCQRPMQDFLFLDLENPASIERAFSTTQPQISVLCSALTAVDYCEVHPKEARQVNVKGVESVLESCRRHGTVPVYLSTEYVFDGKSGPYREEDPPHPISVYGCTKWEAEQQVLREPEGLVVRTTVLYSYNPNSKTFLMQLLRNLTQSKKMPVPNDQFSHPTYTPDLAGIILELIGRKKSGLYHLVGPDYVPRSEFAFRIARIFGLDPALIVPKSTQEMGQKAPRPLQAGLVTEKVVRELGRPLVGIEEGLRCVEKGWRENSKALG